MAPPQKAGAADEQEPRTGGQRPPRRRWYDHIRRRGAPASRQRLRAAAGRPGREATGAVALVDSTDRSGCGRGMDQAVPRPRDRPQNRRPGRRRHRHPRSRPGLPHRPDRAVAARRHAHAGRALAETPSALSNGCAVSEDHLRDLGRREGRGPRARAAVRCLRHPSRHQPALPLRSTTHRSTCRWRRCHASPGTRSKR